MFRVFVIKNVAYLSEESDSSFRKTHNVRSQDVELIATYSSRDALSSRQFERALKQYNVKEVIDELAPPPQPTKPFGIHTNTDEQKAKSFARISRALEGRKLSEETKAKMAQAKRGRPSNNKGKKRSLLANIQTGMARKGIKAVENYTWFYDPYTGDEVLLPPGVKPPEGYFAGRSPQSTYDMVTATRYRRKGY